MDAAMFARDRLRDVRLLVAFVAPPSWPPAQLYAWPATWVRGEDGIWQPLDFGRSHRARQLLTLLAVHPDGMNGPAASRYFDVESEPAETDPGDVSGPRDERAKSALATLRAKLADNGVADVSGLLDVAPGHRRSRPWRLAAVTTDVRIARQAAEAGQWELAWLLLHGGAGRLVSVPRLRPTRRGRTPPHLGLGSDERQAMRTGVLPAALIAEAEEATRLTLAHLRDADAAPPQTAPGIVAEMLHAMAPDVPAAVLAPATAPALGGVRSPAPRDAEPGPVEVRPLTVPAHSRRRLPAPAAAGLGAVLAGAAAVVLILALTPGRSRGGLLPRAPGAMMTASGGRLEVQTFVSQANSFRNPRSLDGGITKLRAGATVLVACRRYVPGPSSFAPYWWYRLASPLPGRWVPANSFLNGDTASDYLGPHPHPPRHQHAVDTAVTLCQPGAPGGTLATPLDSATPTFAAPATGAGPGPPIAGRRAVVVSCKVASAAPASEPGGYAYRIASAPWDGRRYAPARAFANAIPADSATTELVDPEIPDCPA